MSAAAEQKHDPFYWLSEMNKASAVMVVEQGIVPKALGAKIADAVAQVIADGDKPGAPRSGNYLIVERDLIKAGGPDITRLHSGRSRQDIGATVAAACRCATTCSPPSASSTTRAPCCWRWRSGIRTPSSRPTHGACRRSRSRSGIICSPMRQRSRARPSACGEAYARLNLSPLGAAALGTSSFPVNRPRLAELLGFDGVVENSLDANQISPIDTGAELVGIAAAGALTIRTLVADITQQYAQTQPWLLLAEGEMTGTSSIMPQKRNPSGLVFLRAQASHRHRPRANLLMVAHNVAAGMSDYKPFINPVQGDQPNNVDARDCGDLFDTFGALMKTLVFNEARALAEVDADYSTTTELADTLQRVAEVPFRVGHHFASELVNYGRGNNLKPCGNSLCRGAEDLRRSGEGVQTRRREIAADRGAVPHLADGAEHGGDEPGPWRPATGGGRAHAGIGKAEAGAGSRLARHNARQARGQPRASSIRPSPSFAAESE